MNTKEKKNELTPQELAQKEHEKKEALGKVIKKLNEDLDKIDPKGYFWCPKEFSDYGLGFTLYIYGGHAFDLYYGGTGGNVICLKKFAKKYGRFDSQAMKLNDVEKDELISPTWKKIGKANACLSTVLALGDEWEYVLKMFKNWAEANIVLEDDSETVRKTNTERYRENILANKNRNNTEGIKIIEMESSIALEKPTVRRDGTKHSHAKPDMIGLREEGDTYVISFIEYKCTTNAVSGDVSLPEHYEDMYAYYKNKAVLDGIVRRYNFAREVLGEPERLDANLCKSEIVFLFSHVSETDEDPKQLKYTWIGSKVIQMMQIPGYSDKDIRFLTLKEKHADRLELANIVSPGFDIVKYQENLKKQKKVNVYKKECYEKIGQLFYNVK